jgi:sugar lactone lactonase YvrE
MTDRRRKSLWHRAGPIAVVGVALAAAAAPGCGSDNPATTTTTSTGAGGDTTTATSSATTGSNGTGGSETTSTTSTTTSSSGTGGALAKAIGTAADINRALDATPDPDGVEIYFTANGANGLGVYKAPADGSAPTAVAVYPTIADDPNNPFVAPFGIGISSDGKQLFISDSAAGASDRGGIFELPVGGGAPTELSGTDGTSPHSLDVVAVGGVDTIYFTGTEPKAGGLPGVFSVPATGGALTTISVGGILRDPSGIVVSKTGDIYVADTIAAEGNTAQIVMIPAGGGAPSVIVSGLRLGYPAGVALTMDEKSLFVSAFNPDSLTDRLVDVDLAAKTSTETFSAEIGMFTESAGLHRAKKLDVFAWADSSAGVKGGKVFVIK